jgi:curved DNA-binding protein CbpA
MSQPAPSAAPNPVDTCKRLLKAVESGADHFALLGVPTNAGPTEVRDAYFKLARFVHPDLPTFMQRPNLRADATKAFQAITTAHATLADVQKRDAYMQQLRQSKLHEKQAQADAAPQQEGAIGFDLPANPDVAKIYLHRGRQQIQRRDWAGAQEALELAAKVLKDDLLEEARLLLGWAIQNNAQNPEKERLERPKALWTDLTEKTKSRDLHAQAAYYLAMWHKQNGDMASVSRWLKECLKQDARHVEALREKRLLEMRRNTSELPVQPSKKPSSDKNAPQKDAAGSFMDKLAESVTKKNGDTGPQKGKDGKLLVGRAALEARKVQLEKEPTFWERLFGKK